MRHHPISSTLFKDRRKEFAKKMEPGSLAIFYSNDEMPRTADQLYPYRQDSSLFALTGIDQPETILVLHPGAKNESLREILFIKASDPLYAIWNGETLSPRQARTLSGISSIRLLNDWKKMMPSLIRTADAIYMNTGDEEKSRSPIVLQNDRAALDLKKDFPSHTFHHAHKILRQLRMIKHPLEIDLLKKAIDITGLAFEHLLHQLKPGMKEFEAEAEITYIMAKQGCRHAFEPIVASGKSACTLHYVRNDKVIRKDSMVLLDFGVEYAGMNSDMTRTIPASGKFTPEQKKVYSAVLSVLTQIMPMMAPGITFKELNQEAGKLIESELIKLKLLTKHDIRRQDPKQPLRKKYFMHGIGHHLGYDVHDMSDTGAPLKAGMVITCEPGLYIPEWSIGIRLENDMLITRKGSQNLMAHIPIEMEEIESAMNS